MQLILDTQTTVDLKTKMSLNEDNLEKSVPDVLPNVHSGGISKGDATNGNKEATDVKANNDVAKLEQLKDSISLEMGIVPGNNGDIKSSSDLETTDIPNGTDSVNKDQVDNLEPIEELNKINECQKSNNATVEEDCTEPTTNCEEPELKLDCSTENINETTDESEKKKITETNSNNIESITDSGCVSDSSGNSRDLVDIKIENNETAISDNIKTELIDNIDKVETEDYREINNEKSLVKQEQLDESELSLKTDNHTVETETTEDVAVHVEADTSDENIDLIRLDLNSDGYDQQNPLDVNETRNVEKENIKSNNGIEIKVDTSSDHVKVKDTEEFEHKTPTGNAIDCSEQKDCELIETDTATPVALDPNNINSDDSIVNLDKEISIDRVDLKETESAEIIVDDDKPIINCDDDTELIEDTEKSANTVSNSMNVVIDLDENVPKETQDSKLSDECSKNLQTNTSEKTMDDPKPMEPVLKLSNTLDILSDDEEEQTPKSSNSDNKCINIEDDDDVMLIDDDVNGTENKSNPIKEQEVEKQFDSKPESSIDSLKINEDNKSTDEVENILENDITVPGPDVVETISTPEVGEKIQENTLQVENKKPVIPENFLKTCKKNFGEMTREELEEFCILKIVESILDRSNLSEIKNKLKTLTQNIDEYKKKALMLSKQNRDLQVVLTSVQEDVKKYNATPIVPLKITRSVGMQVLMSDKPDKRKRVGIGMPNANVNKTLRNPGMQGPRPQKPSTQQIPVPRLVPANSPGIKSPNQQQVNTGKVTSPLPNGVKNVTPMQKAEKRAHNRIQSVTVDLTDDEPPTKVVNRTAGPVPPVRLVPSQNLLAPPRIPVVNSPRKVYIPISGPQGQNVRAGQTIMLKTVPASNPRQRVPPPHMVRMPQSLRMSRPAGMRHPAPLPECMKQYQPPNWKALPPAPDLKLAKVENGIVISWKIEGYQEDSYEEIASYQLYAYQETTTPPNTALWKKIGDVKALPLPMACTLTQFMAGYKYYFAVRAVDIRSRLGPFSLPGSILLLNKM